MFILCVALWHLAALSFKLSSVGKLYMFCFLLSSIWIVTLLFFISLRTYMFYIDPRHGNMCLRWFVSRKDTNRLAVLQKPARALKLSKQVLILYYQCCYFYMYTVGKNLNIFLFSIIRWWRRGNRWYGYISSSSGMAKGQWQEQEGEEDRRRDGKPADQTARMRWLICAFVVRIWHQTWFLLAPFAGYGI